MSVSTRVSLSAPEILSRTKDLVDPALRAAVDGIEDPRMRLIAGYQLGWWDVDGRPDRGGGKAIRPALAVLAAQACGGDATAGLPAAIAVELVHNFSLLHDDVMDRDVERRHRPTGWVAFGDGQAILAGSAMLTAAIEALTADGAAGQRCLPVLLAAVQHLISGQAADLALEGNLDAELDEVLAMQAGKTAALLACSCALGARAVDAPAEVVAGLDAFGHEVGLAFQLVDDVLGVVGDPATTGKSASSDVRARKSSAPIVAALRSGTDASGRLAEIFAAGAPETDDAVEAATALIIDAGGLTWARDEARRRLVRAHDRLAALSFPDPGAAADLATVADFIVSRDR